MVYWAPEPERSGNQTPLLETAPTKGRRTWPPWVSPHRARSRPKRRKAGTLALWARRMLYRLSSRVKALDRSKVGE